jgi:hypothetical protein
MVKKTVGRVRAEVTLKAVLKAQSVYADVMHVDGKMSLVSVTEPLNLMLQNKIENESRTSLRMGLQGQLAVLQSRGFVPETVHMDPHSTFRAMSQDFPSVTINMGGVGDDVAKVDAKICKIKETYKKIKLGLLWKLPAGGRPCHV